MRAAHLIAAQETMSGLVRASHTNSFNRNSDNCLAEQLSRYFVPTLQQSASKTCSKNLLEELLEELAQTILQEQAGPLVYKGALALIAITFQVMTSPHVGREQAVIHKAAPAHPATIVSEVTNSSQRGGSRQACHS